MSNALGVSSALSEDWNVDSALLSVPSAEICVVTAWVWLDDQRFLGRLGRRHQLRDQRADVDDRAAGGAGAGAAGDGDHRSRCWMLSTVLVSCWLPS